MAAATDKRTQIVDDFSPVVEQPELAGPAAVGPSGQEMDPVSFRQIEFDGGPSEGPSEGMNKI